MGDEQVGEDGCMRAGVLDRSGMTFSEDEGGHLFLLKEQGDIRYMCFCMFG